MATSRTRKTSATRDANKARPLVIATMNEKGGAGKTTLSVLLAAVLAEKQRVLLADLDEQGTAHAWSTWAQYPGSLTVERVGHRVEDALAAAAGSYEVAILDCPPGYSDRSMAAVIAAATFQPTPAAAQQSGLVASSASSQIRTRDEAVLHSSVEVLPAVVRPHLRRHPALEADQLAVTVEQCLALLAHCLDRAGR